MSTFDRHRLKIVPAVLLVAALVAAFVFRDALVRWFSGAPMGGTAHSATTRVGDLSLEVRLDPDPPRQQNNTLDLRIRDAQEKPLEGATVRVRYKMPAMGAMPEMKGDAQVEARGKGEYRARFSLPMGGTWTLEIDVKSTERSASVAYGLTVGQKGLSRMGGGALAAEVPKKAAEPEPLPRQRLAEPVLASLRVALEAYEEIRARLASDTLDGVPERAQRAAQALRSAVAACGDAPSVAKVLARAAEAADALARDKDLGGARLKFGDLSRELLLVVAADDRLAEGRHVFHCPMAQGYDKWIQTNDKLENPYMGPKMLTCGSETEMPRDAGAEQAEHAHAAASEIAHYTCSMHPSVKQAEPGKCPICGMDLTPVTKEEVETGVIVVDAARRQLIGVKTAAVERRAVKKTIRTVGKITYDETRLVDVSVKFKGWIGQLFADETGQRVKKGSALFTVYSPEVYGALQDLLIARGSSTTDSTGSRPNSLLEAAKQRLSLWDVPSGVARATLEKGQAPRYVPIVAPASGFIVEKNVVEGSTVEPGARLFRIANLDKVWIAADLYESELPLVEVGQKAAVTLTYLPDKRFDGKVMYVYPYLSGKTRTGQVRIELDNRKVELKPDMYANVELEVDRGQRLMVPESAVIYAGRRRLVFIDLGEGKLRPQEVQVGLQVTDAYEVLGGLSEGQRVVTSGNFLIAAESRLKSATQQW